MKNDVDTLVKEVNRLICKIASGENDALDHLFELTSYRVGTMAKRYLADKSSCDDAVSETYLKVVRYADKFDKSKNGLNWIYKIAKNTALNLNTAYKRENTPLDEAEEVGDVADVMNTDSLEKASLYEAIKKLSAEERHLLYLRYWEGYTIRQTAKLSGLPTMTMQNRIKKILEKLKGYLI